MAGDASDPSFPPSGDPRDPESIARVVLGQSGDAERKAALELIASDPEIRRLAATIADIREAIAADAQEAADAPPASLFERANALSSRLPQVPSWFDRLRAAILVPIEEGLAGFAQPALRGARMDLRSFELEGWRVDLAVEQGGDGTTTLRMQLEAAADDLSGECIALDSVSGALIARAPIDTDGAATLVIAQPAREEAGRERRVDIAIRSGGAVRVAEGIALR